MQSSLPPRLRQLGVVLWMIAAACAGGQRAGQGSLCRTCDVSAVGEAPGHPSTHWCAGVTKKVVLSETAARQLRFVDVGALERRLEAPIEVSMGWTSQQPYSWLTNQYSVAVGGYDPRTQVQLATQVLGYVHGFPDPAICDGSLCRYPPGAESPRDQGECREELYLEIVSSVRTRDGAVDAEVHGTVRIAGPSAYDAGDVDHFFAHTFTNLARVRGGLQLQSTQLEPVRGYLSVQRTFTPEGISGHVWPTLIFEREQRGTSAREPVLERPLWGNFSVGHPSEADQPLTFIPGDPSAGRP